MIKRFNAILALILMNTLMFGDALSFVTPQTAGTSGYLNTGQSTALSVNNPAITANTQRYTFDFSYFFLTGLTGDEKGLGNIVNLSAAMPSKLGVFSTTVNGFFNSDISTSDLNLGNTGHVNLNFSKELYSDLYFGAGVTGLFGTPYNGDFDWGLGLNLGLIKLLGDYDENIKDIRIGGAVNNIGKPYGIVDSFLDPIVPSFNPSLFIDFSPYSSDKVGVKLSSELSFPNVSNVNLRMGAGVNFLKNFNIESAVEFDLESTLDKTYDRLIPSLYLSYNLNPSSDKDVKSKYDEAQFYISANPYDGGIWAFGGGGTMPIGERDSNPPKVDIDYSDTNYISPNFDGNSDELVFPISVTDERYIAGFEFEITDNFGKVVKRVVNKEERPENESIKNLYSKLVTPKSGIPVPDTFRWDGVEDSGATAQDGIYHFTTTFYDDNGNRTKSKKYKFVIDSTKPELNLSKPTGLDLIFSPNGDGNKDVLTIPQSGTKEALWTGEISDFMGNVVRSANWNNKKPGDFSWDGKDNSGQLVPDGVYKYTLKSEDLAGNSNEDFVDNIIINTKQPPIGITIDTNTFSPNKDGVKDTMEFVLDIPVKTGIVSWTLNIKNKDGKTLKEFATSENGFSVIEDNIIYRGDKRGGGFLEEGNYYGELSVVYQNGHSPIVDSPEFNIDLTAPEAQAKKSYGRFSPNGDGSKDEMVFTQSSSTEEKWLGEIKNEFGEVVYSKEWITSVDSKFTWDGKNLDGELLEDGEYFYTINGTDKAGNSYTSAPETVVLDNSTSTVTLTSDLVVFSPNGDDFKDDVIFSTIVNSESGVDTWELSISNKQGTTVKSYTGSGNPQKISWDGKNDAGEVVSDGEYGVVINLVNENGNRPKSSIPKLVVDTLGPNITASVNYKLFSPDGDGQKDEVTITQSGSGEELYRAVLESKEGELIREWYWKESVENLVWDGRDNSGNILKDGLYRYSISTEDRAGNKNEVVIDNLEIDNSETDIYITYKNPVFAPELFEEQGGQIFGLIVNNKKGIDSWKIDIVDSLGEVAKTLTGRDSVPESAVWDGKDINGNNANGIFKAEFTVFYKKGNTPSYMTKTFIADSQPPLVKVSTTPTPFSPDNDYVDDELTIEFGVKDDSRIKEWIFSITDPKGNDFISFGGEGKPGNRIIWDGKSSKGELVQAAEEYNYTMIVTDEAGYKGVAKGEIPVDILVIKDGDKLKIQISSIIFQPNSTTLDFSGSNGESNRKILKRLSEILKKYSSYKIIVEGHANNIYGDEITKNQKESLVDFSKNRAESVIISLIDNGINKNRLSSIGMGGDYPVVSVYDHENTWKNRRVEFILVK